MLTHQPRHELAVADVAMHEAIAVLVDLAAEVLRVACVGEGVEIEHLPGERGLGEHVANERRPDEAAATSDQQMGERPG